MAEKQIPQNIRDASGEQLRLAAEVCTDITEQKRAEDSLRESARRFRELAELLPEVVYEVDSSGNLTFVNQRAFEIFGYAHEDFERGVQVTDMLVPEDRERAGERIGRLLEGEEVGLSEYTGLRRDGSRFPILVRSAPILRDGRIAGVRGIVLDVTAQKQRLESIGTLAGGIAHDFNNMLAAITGFTELALLESGQNKRQRARLEEVLKAGKRARDLANPTQLHQVLINLFSNAAHAMGRDPGILQVELTEADLDAEAAAKHADLEPGPYLKLSVKDTGHGMESAVAERVFDPFFTTKGPGEGTGMGLAVAYGIVKGHRGTIRVRSEPGWGTTFTVLLPRLEQEADSEEKPDLPIILCTGFSESVDGEKAESLGIREVLMKPILTGDLARAIRRVLDSTKPGRYESPVTGTVLVLDDDAQIREMVRQVLEMEGYAAMEASDGRQGVRLCREHSVDLVITDIFMPEKDGLQAIREIRQDAPNTKIIAISGGGETVAGDFLHHARLFGADRVFAKPLRLSELVASVRELLHGHGLEVRSSA